MAETENALPKMSIVKAFVVYYIGILVFLQVFSILMNVSRTLALLLLFVFMVLFLYNFLWMTARCRANAIHRCFDMGTQRVQTTALLIVISSIFFPLYPIFVAPLVGLAVIQMMRGKCNQDF